MDAMDISNRSEPISTKELRLLKSTEQKSVIHAAAVANPELKVDAI